MSQSRKLRRQSTRTTVLLGTTAIMLIACGSYTLRSARSDAGPVVDSDVVDAGRAIFHREWLVDDPRSESGDGLGPLFNESSCVGCHNMGGAGGAGPVEKNVELLTASLIQIDAFPQPFDGDAGSPFVGDSSGQDLLAAIHPGFRDGDTVVLHRFGTDRAAHGLWRSQAQSGAILAQQSFIEAGDVGFDGPITFAEQIQQVGPGQPFDSEIVFDSLEEFGLVPASSAVDPNQFPVISRVLQRIAGLKADVHPVSNSATSTGTAVLQTSQRNTSPLFGIGLIDAIPDEVIEAVAERQSRDSEVSGRVHRLEDGRIGRFGWKAQKASLYDFTMAACAVELGLHVPHHAQTEVPYDADYEAPGLDLNQEQVEALVAYLRELPPPVQNDPEEDEARERIGRGRELFEMAGCAACHVEQMGDVEGLYSDLLLHDLGGELGGVGHYGVQPSASPESEEPPGLTESGEPERPSGPGATEWRTPPLWGCRDSGPYLHDGRAKTLETAIAFHSGEGDESRMRFFMLADEDQQLVVAFLKTLTAPPATE